MAMFAPEVNPEPIPNVRLQPAATEETFGGGPGLAAAGNEAQKLFAQTGEIGALERIRANQAAAQEGIAKLSAIHTDILTNPQTGLPAYQGVKAMEGQDKLYADYKKAANGIAEKLPNAEAQGLFNRAALEMGNGLNQQLHAHVAQELERHDANTFSALVYNMADNSGKTYGNRQILDTNNSIVDDAAQARAQRLGLDENETKKFMRGIKTTYHETVLSQMVNDPNFIPQAKKYFSEYRDEMDTESQDRVRQLLDVTPKQHDAESKRAQEEFYKANMRQAMLDMFDGKMTLSEAQRLFRENRLDKGDYDLLESKLSKPDAAAMRAFEVSDPPTFNAIRQAQLTGSASPGDIQRMIAQGAADKKITPDDGKYLTTINSEKPPTPRDRYIEGAANNIRDFGNRYFAETNLFGMPTDKDKTSKEADALVQDFYSTVDKSKAQQGQQIDEIRDRVLKTAMQKRYPGLGNLEKAPDIVIGVKGNVTRLLNPDQHSGLKPKYRIVPTGSANKEES